MDNKNLRELGRSVVLEGIYRLRARPKTITPENTSRHVRSSSRLAAAAVSDLHEDESWQRVEMPMEGRARRLNRGSGAYLATGSGLSQCKTLKRQASKASNPTYWN